MVHFTQCGSTRLFYSSTVVIESLLLGYPIRLSRDQRICAPPPGFSQLITTFFASWLLGIHHKPHFRLTIISFLLYSLLNFRHSFKLLTGRSCLSVTTHSKSKVHITYLFFKQTNYFFLLPSRKKNCCFLPSLVMSNISTSLVIGDKGIRTPDPRLAKPML